MPKTKQEPSSAGQGSRYPHRAGVDPRRPRITKGDLLAVRRACDRFGLEHGVSMSCGHTNIGR